MKLKLAAAFLLVALTGILIPGKTVAQTQKSTIATNQEVYGPGQFTRITPSSVLEESQPVRKSSARPNVRATPQSIIQTTASRRDYSKEEVQALIIQYSQQYGSSSNIALAIARCESGFNQYSKNKASTASGVFQWLSSSWKNQPASQGGTVSVFDAEANISAAAWLIAHGQTSPWNASKSCWNH